MSRSSQLFLAWGPVAVICFVKKKKKLLFCIGIRCLPTGGFAVSAALLRTRSSLPRLVVSLIPSAGRGLLSSCLPPATLPSVSAMREDVAVACHVGRVCLLARLFQRSLCWPPDLSPGRTVPCSPWDPGIQKRKSLLSSHFSVHMPSTRTDISRVFSLLLQFAPRLFCVVCVGSSLSGSSWTVVRLTVAKVTVENGGVTCSFWSLIHQQW